MTDREKEVKSYLKRKKTRESTIEMFKALFLIVSYIIGIICAFMIFIYKIKNPQFTQTEIMLYSLNNYWWIVLLCIISTLINNK